MRPGPPESVLASQLDFDKADAGLRAMAKESVREINTAVDHVGNLAQQNSSLMEQAAAESMHEQANALARQVMVFRVV